MRAKNLICLSKCGALQNLDLFRTNMFIDMEVDEIESHFEYLPAAHQLLYFGHGVTAVRKDFLLICKYLPDQISPATRLQTQAEWKHIQKKAEYSLAVRGDRKST